MLFLAQRRAVRSQGFRLLGKLSTASSSSPVTSATRTVSGTGTLKFASVASDGGTPQYSKNGGAFANITEGMTLAVVSSDTLAVRATLGTVGFSASFNLTDNTTGANMEVPVLLVRTA